MDKSTIPGARLGIFSDMFIHKYTWLAEFEGAPLPVACDSGVCQSMPNGCIYASTVSMQYISVDLTFNNAD